MFKNLSPSTSPVLTWKCARSAGGPRAKSYFGRTINNLQSRMCNLGHQIGFAIHKPSAQCAILSPMPPTGNSKRAPKTREAGRKDVEFDCNWGGVVSWLIRQPQGTAVRVRPSGGDEQPKERAWAPQGKGTAGAQPCRTVGVDGFGGRPPPLFGHRNYVEKRTSAILAQRM